MTDKIEPVARWTPENADVVFHMRPNGEFVSASDYDTLVAERDALRALCRDMLPVFEAARPLVLNLERLRDAARPGSGEGVR